MVKIKDFTFASKIAPVPYISSAHAVSFVA